MPPLIQVFVTLSDFIYNGRVGKGSVIHPMAHVYSENWRLSDQYFGTMVTVPLRPFPAPPAHSLEL